MKLELTLLSEDIELGNYFDSENCPITKALERSGRSDIKDKGNIEIDGIFISEDNNKSYIDLLLKLYGMYNYLIREEKIIYPYGDGCFRYLGEMVKPIKPQTFTHTLTY